MSSKMKCTKGERLNIHFNSKIKLEFHGARLTSDGGLLAYRELEEALGLLVLFHIVWVREFWFSSILCG